MGMITAFTTPEPIDHAGLYARFLERETDASGTIVLHHGRVKRPGKQVPDFSAVELAAVAPPAVMSGAGTHDFTASDIAASDIAASDAAASDAAAPDTGARDAAGRNADSRLEAVAREAKDRFGLNQVLIVHRLGRVSSGDSVLLAIVSSKSRGPAFAACAWIVDEIKKEEFITLTELP